MADAFDAMTSPRAFRRPRSVAAALADLHQSSGTQFDPDIVTVFLAEAHRLGEKLKDIPLPKASAEETPAPTEPAVTGS
ncbi:MAG: hypothetical protein NTV86_20730 [Planctomycetota bacterium]|nr:hypothetical protein [Planctomycetota bacterium]